MGSLFTSGGNQTHRGKAPSQCHTVVKPMEREGPHGAVGNYRDKCPVNFPIYRGRKTGTSSPSGALAVYVGILFAKVLLSNSDFEWLPLSLLLKWDYRCRQESPRQPLELPIINSL